MSSYTAVTNEIRRMLQAGVTANSIPLPLVWPNDRVDPAVAANNGFIYSEIDVTHSNQIALGAVSNRYRDHGEVRIYVYVAVNSKVGTLEQYCEQLRELWKTESTNLTDLRFDQTGISHGRDDHESKFFSAAVTAQFWYDRYG